MADTYWKKRAALELMGRAHRSADDVSAQLTNAQTRAFARLQDDIQHLIKRFMSVEDLTKDEAMALLRETISSKEIDGMIARTYQISDPTMRRELQTRLTAQAFKSRITRKEYLQDAIRLSTGELADDQLQLIGDHLINITGDTYLRSIYNRQVSAQVGFGVSSLSARRIDAICKTKWSGKNYSSRIWSNAKQLSQELEQSLLTQLYTGHKTKDIAEVLSKRMEVSQYAAERLLRTETSYVVNRANIEGAKTCGIDMLEFVATLDLRTSAICQEHDGKRIPVIEAMPGVNVPPMHPNCRSITIDVSDLTHKVRRARDPKTGNNMIVPADTRYEDWKAKFVDVT